MAYVQAQIDCLLKENIDLKAQVADREAKLKDTKALTATAFEEKVRAQDEHEKAVAMAWKVHVFVGYLGDMLNKAQLYDENMKEPEVMPAPKVLQCLIDYNVKMEKLLSELHALLQPNEQREEAGPSERRPELGSVPVSEPEPEPVSAS